MEKAYPQDHYLGDELFEDIWPDKEVKQKLEKLAVVKSKITKDWWLKQKSLTPSHDTRDK